METEGTQAKYLVPHLASKESCGAVRGTANVVARFSSPAWAADAALA